MAAPALHRFEQGGRRFVVDTETCFCFECDAISWAVLEHYPHTPANHILHLLEGAHPPREVEEVIGELEWLRATNAILPAPNAKERLRAFDLDRELRAIDVRIRAGGQPAPTLIGAAIALLLGRSGSRNGLLLRIDVGDGSFTSLEAPLSQAFRDARLAGKTLTLEIATEIAPGGRDARATDGHAITVALPLGADTLGTQVQAFLNARGKTLSQLAALCGGTTSATLVPGHGAFSEAVAALRAAGFRKIDVDIPAAYTRNAALDSAEMLAGMRGTAVYYAQELHAGNDFLLEPVASTFHQIYEGTPRPRSDPSGTHQLAVDEQGDIYPSRALLGIATFCLGNVCTGELDEARRGAFDDLGALTTSPCIDCWARNLCGGGHSAIHWTLEGGIRRPNAAWCDAQRDWFASAIASFNLLASHGVNFDRLYANLQPAAKPSLWQAVRAAATMKVGVRPIQEADAALLTRWENWSDAVYFLGNEYGMFLATQYDREMDSLHPRGFEQELMVVSRRGEPMGLVKIRPEPRLNLARMWIYLRTTAHYADRGVRRSFSRFLSEAVSRQAFTTVLAAAGPGDAGLAEFLEALGFTRAGVERDALFLHDVYHDIQLFSLRQS